MSVEQVAFMQTTWIKVNQAWKAPVEANALGTGFIPSAFGPGVALNYNLCIMRRFFIIIIILVMDLYDR